MFSPRMIRVLDAVARVLRPDKRHLPFGGVQLIFVGDFFQLSPVFTEQDRLWTEAMVKEHGSDEEGDDLAYDFAFEHPLWEEYIGTANVVLLRQNFRQVRGNMCRALASACPISPFHPASCVIGCSSSPGELREE
jgi:ATP-dependent DNA helicase PIF1